MNFLWPDALWFLLLVPLLVAAYVLALRRRKRAAIRYASLVLVRDAVGPGQRIRRHLPPALFLLGLTAAIFAVARPTATVVLPNQTMTIAMAIDVSRSMQATDVEPDRLSAAQSAARSFIEELPRNVRLGLVTFAGTAAVVQTPTESREDLLAAVDRFQLQRATATGSGLILALGLLFPEDGFDVETVTALQRSSGAMAIDRARLAERAQKRADVVPVGSYSSGVVILLSDGRRTTGPDPVEVARMAAERGVRVYTVGFGTRDGAMITFDNYSFYVRLDEETLQSIAKVTGGEYFHAGTAADLRAVYQHLNAKIALERRDTEIGALFSGIAAGMLLLAALFSLLWFHRLPARSSSTSPRA